MLTIHYGDVDGVIYNTSVFFNNTYSPKWFEDPFAQKVIEKTRGTHLAYSKSKLNSAYLDDRAGKKIEAQLPQLGL